MDLGQLSETNLINNGQQNTELAELTSPCPDKSSERNHVCSLLNISDITHEKDAKAKEFVIGTGWEEAVQGWGSTSPMACIWPRKKGKKSRPGEGSSSCLFCVNISQGSPEARPQTGQGKWEARAQADTGSGKDQGSTALRETSKTCFSHCCHGSEKKSLQIKEYIWCARDWHVPETVKGKDPKGHERVCGSQEKNFSLSESLTSKALLVLPPLKASPPASSLDALGKKGQNTLLLQEEEVPSVDKDAGVACAWGLKAVDEKGERRPMELAKHFKVKDMPPFPAEDSRPSLLAEAEPGYLPWSLLSERSVPCPPPPSNMHYLATLQLLQRQGIHNYRAKLRPKGLRIPASSHKPVLPETKQENQPHKLETKVFSRPLLPSLTVSRVIIPISSDSKSPNGSAVQISMSDAQG
ncbi:uncharacterized protein C16orf46 homolog [Echinops telfairi]|uniref:Uncharacterized protein C16orf46 homolog n=1 Tax=Echinops telfairi TaxID=9371 RepID=A0ABM0IPK9_ECHTE|nr:uncharacterized protein C16orf46 homolog [Echinops telfairi]